MANTIFGFCTLADIRNQVAKEGAAALPFRLEDFVFITSTRFVRDDGKSDHSIIFAFTPKDRTKLPHFPIFPNATLSSFNQRDTMTDSNNEIVVGGVEEAPASAPVANPMEPNIPSPLVANAPMIMRHVAQMSSQLSTALVRLEALECGVNADDAGVAMEAIALLNRDIQVMATCLSMINLGATDALA